MTRSLLSQRRRGGRSMLRSHLTDAGEALLCRFAARAFIRWLRDVDRPPRRSLSNELLIARGTPPNLGGEFSKPRTNGQSPDPCSLRRGISCSNSDHYRFYCCSPLVVGPSFTGRNHRDRNDAGDQARYGAERDRPLDRAGRDDAGERRTNRDTEIVEGHRDGKSPARPGRVRAALAKRE